MPSLLRRFVNKTAPSAPTPRPVTPPNPAPVRGTLGGATKQKPSVRPVAAGRVGLLGRLRGRFGS